MSNETHDPHENDENGPGTHDAEGNTEENPTEPPLAPLSEDTQSGERDYVATNAGGFGTERGNPLPEDEQGRGTEYDPVDQGPQREG